MDTQDVKHRGEEGILPSFHLPFVAPITGVREQPWALAWQKVLEQLGLLHVMEPYGPICKALTSEGGFTKRPLSSAEASSMINGFIGAAGKSIATTSHSLKSTTLVWWARYGIDATSRAMLGHHSIQDKSFEENA